MILQELMVVSLNDREIRRRYKFKEVGVNLILGVKKQENDESNGVGKTDMIDSIRYILGKNIPTQFNNTELKDKDIFFVLKAKVKGKKSFYLGRRVIEPDKGYILNNVDIIEDIEKWECIDSNNYKEYIQRNMYSVNSNDDIPPFPSVMEYVIRDEKQGFNEIYLLNRKAFDAYRILSFLCEVPYNLEKQIKPLKDEQKEYNKQLAVIKSMDFEILELKARKKRLEDDIRRLGKIISDVDISAKFDVDEVKYKKNKEILNKIQSDIFELEYILKQYKQNITDLQEKVDKARLVNGLGEFYEQIIGYFPDKLKKNYKEMQMFYNFMLDNRGLYFKEKIKDVENELIALNEKKRQLKQIILETSRMLKNTELVDDINNLSEELTSRNKELAEAKVRIEMYDQKANINKKINELKVNILQENERNEKIFEEYKNQRNLLENIFLSLIGTAYSEEEGFLSFEYENKTTLQATTGRIKIHCRIMDEKSHGRLYMKINIFDLTWFLSRVINNSDIQLLVHDGSYCKPDPIVKEKVLSFVDKKLNELGRGQYFVTANVDELTIKTIEDLRKSKGVIAEFNRQEGEKNRFLGFRYQNVSGYKKS